MFDPIEPDDTFPLWRFGDVITRGRTLEEAAYHVGRFGRPALFLDVGEAEWYTTNHAPGWLSRPMYWLCEALGLDPREHGHG